jgi:protein involved in polysaccharide export with SLBB domain/capsular polysaccharide biosynthesis protein
MNNPGELSLKEINRRREEAAQAGAQTPSAPSATAISAATASTAAAAANPASAGPSATAAKPLPANTNAGGPPIPFDPLRLVTALLSGWWKLLLSAGLLAGAAGAFGFKKFETNYTATVQLMRRELPNTFRASDVGESFKPRQFSVGTITAMMRSPGLLSKVSAKSQPKVSIGEIAGNLVVTPEKNTDLITVTLKGRSSPRVVADLINLYAEEVVLLTKTLQSQEAAELNRFLKDQLSKTENELISANQEMLAFSRESSFYSADKQVEAYLRSLGEAESRLQAARMELEGIELRIQSSIQELNQQDPARLKLAEAKEALEEMRRRYQDSHPTIVEQLSKIAALEEKAKSSTNNVDQFQAGANTLANNLYISLVDYRTRKETLIRQIPQLQVALTNGQSRLAGVPEKAQRHAKIKARQTALELTRDLLASRQREAELFTENSPGYYRLFAPADANQVDKSSRSKKIIIAAVVGGVLGGLIALVIVCLMELLDDRIRTPSDLRRVCKAKVVAHVPDLAKMKEPELLQWRFRTWSVLQRHLGVTDGTPFVLGLLAAKPGEGCSTWIHLLQHAAAEREWRSICLVDRAPDGAQTLPLQQALADPAAVARQLETSPHLYILFPSETPWDAALRGRWHAASQEWTRTPRTMVLIELPPASRLDAILLAETVPQIFWVGTSESTRSSELSPVFATIRLAEIQITGSFLNRIPPAIARLPDLSKFGLALVFGWAALSSGAFSPARAAEAAAVPGVSAAASTNYQLSATTRPNQLAPWQERLTLGPGDLVNLQVFGQKQLSRTLVPIGPDGRISYLQVNGVMAAGLTIDELRATLDTELGKYIKNPRVIVKPGAWRSKKYFLLGTIMDRGAFPLDRPTTIIEATARARGIATGLLEQNTVEIADLPRAFLIRGGKRVPVDFVRLFQEGDLSQNVLLEPNDYIYFPSSTVNEVYLLGAVSSPGTVGVTDKASLVGVLTTRGAFTARAWRQRVLVIRGSLDKPETHVVDVRAILAGKATNFLVQPKDIIFVAERPWIHAEELLDTAIRTFIQTATATWVGQNIEPTISEPILPGL